VRLGLPFNRTSPLTIPVFFLPERMSKNVVFPAPNDSLLVFFYFSLHPSLPLYPHTRSTHNRRDVARLDGPTHLSTVKKEGKKERKERSGGEKIRGAK
jgi:hypothetical protein